MIFSSCLNGEARCLVVDASVLINLIASGKAPAIVEALPFKFCAGEQAVREIERGADGHGHSGPLQDLVSRGLVEVVPMPPSAMQTFSDLVSGSLAETIGDGEAATIAIALDQGWIAGIDEKKATGICARRYPGLKLATSIDTLAHDGVVASLGRDALSEATWNSLRYARMQVRRSQIDWIVDLIGEQKASDCSSLRRLLALRTSQWRA